MPGNENEQPGPELNAPPTPKFQASQKIPLPPNIKLTGNLKGNWEKFRQLWDSYEILTGLNEATGTVRVATFVTCIGIDALEIHNNLPFKNPDEKKRFGGHIEIVGGALCWKDKCDM